MFSLNEARWDRVARVLLGIGLLVVGWGGFTTGMVATVLGIVGFVPLLTGLVGWCPLYSLFHVNTCRTVS